jgi:acyl-CoA thioester hydrolase
MSFECSFRVYYEDTDAGGVMYYANYLKFADRARTEFLRSLGIYQSTLSNEKGLFFVVRHAELDLEKPARLDDLVNIHTVIESKRGASLTVLQHLHKDSLLLARVKVLIVCVNKEFKPSRLPEIIR